MVSSLTIVNHSYQKLVTKLFFVTLTISIIPSCFSTAIAQTLVPGIHGMSIVQDVKFTWVIISSDKELSVNLRYLGNGSSPPVLITATALTKLTNQLPNTTIGGSQLLNAGWVRPNSLTIPV